MSYSLEKFAEVFEAESKKPDTPIQPDECPFEYARRTQWNRAVNFTYKHVAQMLRGTPMWLYTTYPDHFPNPEEVTDEQ